MSNSKQRKQVLVYVFVAISSLLMALNAKTLTLDAGSTGTDSSVFIYVANMILDGEMPYLHTFDHKGPVLYLINAAGLLISRQTGIWLLELITILITFTFAYKIARLLGCREISACMVVAISALVLNYYFEGGNLVEEYACVFLTISLYLFLRFFITSQIKVWELMLCGASFATVLLLRVNMVVLWAVMCVGVLVFNIKNGFSQKTIGFILWFLLGVALVCIPIMVWLWYNQALIPFVDNYLLFNLKYMSDANTASVGTVVRAIAHFSVGSPMVVTIPILVYFCLYKNSIIDWLCLVALGLSVLSMGLSGRVYAHYGMILYPLVVYAISRASAGLDEKMSEVNVRRKVARAVSSLCVVILLLENPIQLMAKNILSIPQVLDAKTQWHEIAEVVRDNTEEDARISVCGNKNVIYLLSDRKSASKYSYQTPIATICPEIKEEYLADIRKLKAEMIIMSDDIIFYDDIMEFVEQEYTLIDIVGSTHIFLKNK